MKSGNMRQWDHFSLKVTAPASDVRLRPWP